jgi:septum site-determining protein MinC
MENITIKGNKEGIVVYINSSNFDEVKNELFEKINKAKDFFSGSKLIIRDNNKYLDEEKYNLLKELLINNFNIQVIDTKNSSTKKRLPSLYDQSEVRTKFIRNIIRSGQLIKYNGNIVIIGDVNCGAEVIASGSIIILGVLRGIAHAGFNGNRKSYVAAYKLEPSQLRIANLIARAPDNYKQPSDIPEIAIIKQGGIVVEPYLPNKYF